MLKSEYKPWINKTIIIDFVVPNSITQMMELLESLDNPEREYMYYDYAQCMDNMCKSAVAKGDLTSHQWEMIERRYFND